VAEGEGRTDGGEDLFEDLDKFFAPIQDVDWPESKEPLAAPVAREPEPAAEEPAADDEPIRIEDLPEDEPADAGPTPGQEDLFEREPEEESGSVRATQDQEPESPEDGVTSFLFEREADEELDQDAELDEEAFAATAGGYVDLPGSEEEGPEEEVAELAEEVAVAEEAAPDLEAVEAAADHFAESVREEVRVEPDTTESVTEEVQIAALLGAEDEEPAEGGEPDLTRTVRVGQEGLGGPSWQEPTALEVGADTERRSAGRDVPLAALTGLILAVLAIGAIAIGPGAFAVLAAIVILFAQGEFYFALQKQHFQPATALGLASGALVLGAAYYQGESAMLAMMALSVVASFLWFMTVPSQHRRNVAANLGLTILGVAYIPMLGGYALTTLAAFGDQGREIILAIVGLTIAYDIAAFGVGYFWGSRPLAPHISPKKSWEGAVGATLVVIAVAVGAVAPSVEIFDTVGRSVGLALVVAVFAPLGDLSESLIKRDLGIKDMGSILPGHGGVLDRIDSLLFVAPAAFMFLRLIYP
jgi:phosphatidate cytidylyltransferase